MQSGTHYSCAVCQVPVIVLDGQIIRACAHRESPVVAHVSAVVYGEADLARLDPGALALQEVTPHGIP